MDLIEKILKQRGLKYTDLNEAEKQTLFTMVDAQRKSVLTLERWKQAISVMRDAVSKELEDEPEFIRVLFFRFENRKQILLKARLRNYRIMLAVLDAPDKAQKALDDALSNLQPK